MDSCDSLPRLSLLNGTHMMPCIVDQEMERLAGCQELVGESIDGMRIHQIQFFHLYIF